MHERLKKRCAQVVSPEEVFYLIISASGPALIGGLVGFLTSRIVVLPDTGAGIVIATCASVFALGDIGLHVLAMTSRQK